jgi:hypothetical protein
MGFHGLRQRLDVTLTDCISYFDESGDEAHFVVGGLTATAVRWDALALEWKSALAVPPAIPFFKFSNVHKLSAADHGAKIDALIAIVNKHVLRADVGIVEVAEYEIYLSGLIGAGYKKPSHFGYVHTLQQCALHCPEKDGRITFVFDSMEKWQIADLQYAFELFQATCPNEEVKAQLDKAPHCEDDKALPQLQAADLWAGLVRASVKADQSARDYLRKITIPNRAFLWDMGNLAQLVGMSIKRTPDITSGKYYETPGQRKNRLKKFVFGRNVDGDKS